MAGAEEGWNGELVFNAYRVWQDEKVLEMHDGDGCTRMQMYVMPLNCMPKNS